VACHLKCKYAVVELTPNLFNQPGPSTDPHVKHRLLQQLGFGWIYIYYIPSDKLWSGGGRTTVFTTGTTIAAWPWPQKIEQGPLEGDQLCGVEDQNMHTKISNTSAQFDTISTIAKNDRGYGKWTAASMHIYGHFPTNTSTPWTFPTIIRRLNPEHA
jgi:hypothetical protein